MCKLSFFFVAFVFGVVLVQALPTPKGALGDEVQVRVRRETEEERRQREKGWHVNPNVGGDGKDTGVGVEVKRVGEKHDFEAGWKKTVHGPNKAKPSWHVGGSFRF